MCTIYAHTFVIAQGLDRPTKFYRACPTRRTEVDIAGVHAAILDVISDDPPVAVRQVFNQQVVRSAEGIQAGSASMTKPGHRLGASPYSETCFKKGRGMAQRSLDLIEAMHAVTEAAHPITGRGVGYKLFTRALIASMAKSDMQRVYRLLKDARERGQIPWEWIVDENRSIERCATWDDPAHYAECVARSYRRDFWNQQPTRVEVWSEKGTVRGVLAPILDHYAVAFRVMHGFSGATTIHDVAQDDDGRELIVLYVGDFDPSGMFMSERDLPDRLEKYDGDHVTVMRIALTRGQVGGLLSFPASDKKKDPRYKWFVANYGKQCWELDAMDPNDLRDVVEAAIEDEIEPDAWARCAKVYKAEKESMRTFMESFGQKDTE
jgi:hypothetical protein